MSARMAGVLSARVSAACKSRMNAEFSALTGALLSHKTAISGDSSMRSRAQSLDRQRGRKDKDIREATRGVVGAALWVSIGIY